MIACGKMEKIKNKTIKSLFWSAVEKYSRLLISLIISMVLARLLSPQEYGLVAIVSVIIAFLQIFCTMGIAPAIIQRKDFKEDDYDNLFTLTVLIGGFVTLLCFFLSKPIASFYNNPQLVNITRLLSLNLFFSSLNLVPNSLMLKDLRFKEIAIRTLIIQVLAGVLGILMAYKGLGVYALITPELLTTFFMFLYNRNFYKVSISRKFSLKPFKSIFSYSSYQFLFSVTNYFTGNLDKLIIGTYFSASALGIYEKAYRLMQMPLQNVTSVISPVLHPILSHLQDDLSDMANKYNRVVSTIAMVSFPVAIIIFYISGDLIVVLFGDKWIGAIPSLKILALSLPTHMILATSGSVWQASNSTKYLFWVGLINTLVVVAGFLTAAIFGKTIESIAWAWTITAYMNFLFTYLVMYNRIFHSSIILMLKQLINPIVNILILLFCYTMLNLSYPSVNVVVDFIVKTAAGVIVTLVYLQLTHRFDSIRCLNKLRNNN